MLIKIETSRFNLYNAIRKAIFDHPKAKKLILDIVIDGLHRVKFECKKIKMEF